MRYRIEVATDGRAAEQLYDLLGKVVYELAVAFNQSMSIINNSQADMSSEIANAWAENTVYINIGKYYHLNDIGASYCFRPYTDFPVSLPSTLVKNSTMPKGCIAMPLIPGEEAFAYLHQQLLPSGFLNYLEDPSLSYRICFTPDTFGNVVCDFSNGIFLKSLIDNLYALSGMWFEYCVSQSGKNLYIAMPSHDQYDVKQVSPYGVLYALAFALKNDLKLENEAECLYNAINNVVIEHWRTRDIAFEGCREASNSEICKLVCEQISLAGQLMNTQEN